MKLGVALVCVLIAGCTLPNLGVVQEIKPAECVNACKPALDVCFTAVDDRVQFCQSIQDGDNTAVLRQDCMYATGVYKNSKSILLMTKACILADQDCIAACIKDVEDTLKEIK